MNENNLDFVEILEKCLQLQQNKITKRKLFKWFDKNFPLKTYINVQDKYAVALLVKSMTVDGVFDTVLNVDEEKVNDYCSYEVIKNLFIFSQYINNTVSILDRNLDNYNLLLSCGLYDHVREKINQDWERFDKIIDLYSGIETVSLQKTIIKFVSEFDFEAELKSNYEEMKKAKDLPNWEMLRNITI